MTLFSGTAFWATSLGVLRSCSMCSHFHGPLGTHSSLSITFLYWGPQKGHSAPDVVWWGPGKGEWWPPYYLPSLITARTQYSHFFLLPCQSVPSPHLGGGLVCPICSTLYLFLLNFMVFLSAHSLSLLKPLWIAALPSSTLTECPSLVSSTNLMVVHPGSSIEFH